MESFFATLKGECTDRQRWASHSQARQAIFEFLEVLYHRQRRHFSLEHLSPVAYEQLRVSFPSSLALRKRGKPTFRLYRPWRGFAARGPGSPGS